MILAVGDSGGLDGIDDHVRMMAVAVLITVMMVLMVMVLDMVIVAQGDFNDLFKRIFKTLCHLWHREALGGYQL